MAFFAGSAPYLGNKWTSVQVKKRQQDKGRVRLAGANAYSREAVAEISLAERRRLASFLEKEKKAVRLRGRSMRLQLLSSSIASRQLLPPLSSRRGFGPRAALSGRREEGPEPPNKLANHSQNLQHYSQILKFVAIPFHWEPP